MHVFYASIMLARIKFKIIRIAWLSCINLREFCFIIKGEIHINIILSNPPPKKKNNHAMRTNLLKHEIIINSHLYTCKTPSPIVTSKSDG